MSNIQIENKILRQPEAAKYLNVSEAWLERQRWLGQGPAYIKIAPGKRAGVRYRLHDIEAYIKEHTTEQG